MILRQIDEHCADLAECTVLGYFYPKADCVHSRNATLHSSLIAMTDITPNPKNSLGNEPTLDNAARPDDPHRSLGDESTIGDLDSSVSDLDAAADGFVEMGDVVDLSERYEIQEELGRGGMGRVTKAVDRRLKRIVAIKRLKTEISGSRKAMQRFLTEAQAIAALNHFHIVQIHDYGRDADGPFLILEYVNGSNLAERLRKGSLTAEQAIEMTCQLCDALELAHRKGIVHRDFKPANILLTEEERPKLTDFGLARQDETDASQTQSGAVLGTLDYMAPEQRHNASAADARSDLWSVGATLYQMLTGEIPRVMNLESLPIGLREIVGKVLKTNPDERFTSARELAEALRNIESFVTQAGPLSEGQCRGCGTINEVSRKFCRDCGASLRDPCLACDEVIGAWEKFCPECGADQAEVEQQKLEEIADRRRQIETLRRSQQYEQALYHLDEVEQKYGHIRLQQHLNWTEATREALQAEHQQLHDRVAELTAQANDAFASHQYTRVIQHLDGIPESAHTEATRSLRFDATQNEERANSLRDEIREQLRTKEYEGLLPKVDEYLELRPGNTQLINMRPKLKARQDRQERRRLKREKLTADAADSEWSEADDEGDFSAAPTRRRESRPVRAVRRLWWKPAAIIVVGVVVVFLVSHFFRGENPETPSTFSELLGLGESTDSFEESSDRGGLKTERVRWEESRQPLSTVTRLGFAKRPNGTWREEETDGKYYTFNEAQKTDEYVELTGITEPNVVYRLYDDRAMISRNAGTNFEEKCTGGWNYSQAAPDVMLADASDWHDWRCHIGDDVRQGFDGGWGLVEGEAIVSSSDWSNHGNLWTARTFTDFELSLEYKLYTGANSGILFRGTGKAGLAGKEYLEIQLLDYAGWRDANDGQILLLEQRNASLFNLIAPWKSSDKPPGQWNQLKLRSVGDQLTLTLNDAQLINTNLRTSGSTTGRLTTQPALTRREGLIGFQKHTGNVSFRNIRIRDLSSPGTADEAVEMIDSSRLDGWKGHTNYWTVEGDELVGSAPGGLHGGKWLVYRTPQSDFELRCDFQLKRGNSGIQIRSTDWGDRGVRGRQVDLSFDTMELMGCVVGEGIGQPRIAMTSSTQQSRLSEILDPDGWNRLNIRAVGERVTITLSNSRGESVTTVSQDIPNLPASGVIALQLHGGTPTDIRFRNMTIRPISDEEGVSNASLTIPPPPPDSQDLLAKFDINKDVWRGFCRRDGQTLHVTSPDDKTAALLLLGNVPTGDYELTMVARRVPGSFGGITLPIVYAGRQSWVHLAGGRDGTHGMGKTAEVDMFPDYEPHLITCRVTGERAVITNDCGGQFESSVPLRFMTEYKVAGVARNQLFLEVLERFQIYSLRLRESW